MNKKLLMSILPIFTLASLTGCGNNNQPILLLGAMDCETNALIDKLDNKNEIKVGQYSFYKGNIDGYPVVVGKTYVGMVNAAMVSTVAIKEFSPKLIIDQGTAGGHDKSLHQGDIILGNKIIDFSKYETSHRDEGEGVNPQAWVINGNDIVIDGKSYRFNNLESDQALLDIASNVIYQKGKLVKGVISTSNGWNKELDLIKLINETYGSSCEDMETYAVAQVAKSFKIPFLGVRILSNNEYHPEEIFDEKFGVDCQEYTYNLVKEIVKTIK